MNLVKVEDTKLIHRNPLHSYMLTTKKQKEKLRKQSHSLLQTKRIKYLGINLCKETKDLYAKNGKTLMIKEIKDDKNKRRDIPCSWIGRINIVKMTTQSNLQIQCNPYKITNGISIEIEQKIFTICMETQKTLNSESNYDKEKQPSWLHTILQSYSHQDSMVPAQKTEIQINVTRKQAQR